MQSYNPAAVLPTRSRCRSNERLDSLTVATLRSRSLPSYYSTAVEPYSYPE